jgi:MoxR-like ATPase
MRLRGALSDELDPLIGRDVEIERMIQILCRRTKNNPALIGEPGVGKTAIAEGLAQKIRALVRFTYGYYFCPFSVWNAYVISRLDETISHCTHS